MERLRGHPRHPSAMPHTHAKSRQTNPSRCDVTQASLSVKRTSYLNGRQPSPARRSPASASATRQQRPKTAVAGRRRHPPDNRCSTGNYNSNDYGNDNNPLLSHLEREFLFGAGAAKGVAAAAAGQKDEACPAPSLRKTTLGRLLQRSAGSSSSLPMSTAGDLPQHASALSESGSAASLYRRPLSAGSNGGRCADDRPRRRKRPGRGVFFNSRPSSSRGGGNAALLGKARTRPSSAAPGGGRRRRERPSFSAAAGDLPSKPDGKHGHPDRLRPNSSAYRGNKISVDGSTAVRNPANHGAAVTCAHRGGTRPSEGSAAAAVAAVPAVPGLTTRKPSLKVHQVLEATIKAAIGVVSPREQFVNARKTIAEMKKINTKDSTGDILLTTQVGPAFIMKPTPCT